MALKQNQAEFRPEQVNLLLAKCYADACQHDNARQTFIYTTTFGSAEARAEYAILAAENGDLTQIFH